MHKRDNHFRAKYYVEFKINLNNKNFETDIYYLEVIVYASFSIRLAWNLRRVITKYIKKLGFYFGAVDGIFGQQTLDSVYYFQHQFGITVDGVVGRSTWRKLMPYINGIVGNIVPTDMSYPYEIMMLNLDAL